YYENPVLTSKNKERHIIWRNTSLRNEKGEVVGVLSSGEDITERKIAETEITKSEEQLRNLMENVPAGIAITDEEAKLIEYNPAFRNILGFISDEDFEKADVMNTKLGESERDKMFKLIELEGSIRSFETKLTKKDGSQIWGSFSTVKQTLPTGDIHYIHILQDITERKEEEIRLIRQIMRFDLKEGDLYLTLEEYPGTAIEAFKDLQKVGYEGTIISRTPLKEWGDVFDEYVEAYWLSEKMDQQSIMPDFSELEKFIIKLPRRKVLLLDRLEYLIESNDFNSTLRFVYRLKELANMLDLTIIISLDPGTMDSRERTLLEKETNQIERRIHSRISEDLLEVLKYINNENILGNKPSYTDVGKELSISRPTTRQRLQKLIESGFIKETTSGRMKVLEVTQKGRLAL
ncbi:MAG: DUF835 domain-containing protein, partial [Candidatus Heimdallarchaeota archaeon]|nr:DUF835 domain-containing protein [Candidatus Heimdallarchaeota archaeon]MCK4955944.1 DUF835 domain-containing protein [Candidatus Heimdallarchaeota archaeon]